MLMPSLSFSSEKLAIFNGQWHWAKGSDELTLTLKQSGTHLAGHHSAIGQNGSKVDEVSEADPPSLLGEVKGNLATITFKSGFPDSEGGGKATLRLEGRGPQFIKWKIIQSDGEHYLPKEAILKLKTKKHKT